MSKYDEVIISDDSSTDNTLTLVRGLHDARIRIYTNQEFHNPIYNFEFCLTKATGDVIFLADQDDIWLTGKVMNIMNVFSNYPDVTLVASDAIVINAKGETIAETFYSKDFKYTSNLFANILRNRFLGCSLAMRRQMLPVVLPFPRRIPMHDSWLGIMNQLFRKVYFINMPLIAYRKHEGNFHPSTRAGIIRLIILRWHLIIAILGRVFKLCIR